MADSKDGKNPPSQSSTKANDSASLQKKVGSTYHHGDLRNALIQAGIEILRTEGIHKLSLREAARIAGVSQAAPYRHFASKEALLTAIAQEGFALLSGLLRETAEKTRSNPEEQFHQTALTYLELALEHPDHFRLMFEAKPDHVAQNFFKELLAVITRCQKEHVLRPGNPEQLTLVAWSAFHGLASLLANRNLEFMNIPEKQGQLLMRALTRNLLDGLKQN